MCPSICASCSPAHRRGAEPRRARPVSRLRESFREGHRVRKRTLANLSALPDEPMAALRAVLRGEPLHPVDALFEAIDSRRHGPVEAVRVAMRRVGFESLVASRPSRERDWVCAMVAARVLAPHTKLAPTRWWHTTTLAEEFGVRAATRMIGTRSWTGCSGDSGRSRRSSPLGICAPGGSSSTICPRAPSRGRPARWPRSVITETARKTSSRRRTRRSLPEDGRPQGATHSSPACGSRPPPHLRLQARRLRRVAHARRVALAAVG